MKVKNRWGVQTYGPTTYSGVSPKRSEKDDLRGSSKDTDFTSVVNVFKKIPKKSES
jgi:hypothetical protein